MEPGRRDDGGETGELWNFKCCDGGSEPSGEPGDQLVVALISYFPLLGNNHRVVRTQDLSLSGKKNIGRRR